MGCTRELITRVLLWDVVLLGISIALSVAAAAVPCVPWPDGGAFFRTPAFAPGALIFWAGQTFAGFALTTGAVVPQLKLYCSPRRMAAVLAVTVFAYFICPVFVLNGECADEPFAVAAGHSILYRALGYGLPQIIGGHWTFLDSIEGMGDIGLHPDAVKKWKCRQWSVIAGAGVAGVGIAAYDMYLLATVDRLWQYLLVFVGIIVSFVLAAWLLSKRYRPHVHHYCLGLLAPFFPVRESPFSAIMQGLFIGISIEGFSRWGPDPLFYKLDPPAPPTDAAAAAAGAPGPAGGAAVVPSTPLTPNPVAVVDFGGAGAAKSLETMPLAGAASPSLVGDATTATSSGVLGSTRHAASGATQQPNIIGTAVLVPPSPSGTTVVQSPLSVV